MGSTDGVPGSLELPPRWAAGKAIAGLEPISRDDLMNKQVHDLARALFVRALADSGQRDEAHRQARRIRPGLRQGLLPAILVDETMKHVRNRSRHAEP